MTTSPLEDRLDRGREASSIRPPRLIRDYLSGQGEFPEDTPEERTARPAQGDYLARMHRRIKLYIRKIDPTTSTTRAIPFRRRPLLK